MNSINLYGYIFWCNPYEDMWYAIDRDTQLFFFNGDRKKSKYFKSKDIFVLIELISKDNLKEKYIDNE